MKKILFVVVMLATAFISFAQEEDFNVDIDDLKIKSEQGSADAQGKLGYCYLTGTKIEKNEKEACKLFTSGAKGGDAFAQYYLGQCYYNGTGVKQSFSKALQWTNKAAEQEFVKSYGLLGACYYLGRGTVTDKKTAVKWL
jgi:hypothetical protein